MDGGKDNGKGAGGEEIVRVWEGEGESQGKEKNGKGAVIGW
jgi:hypothetical protein